MSIDRLGPAFRAVRLRRAWSQEELARQANVSRWTVVQAENGRLRRRRMDDLERIARALDGTLDVRFRWRGEELDRLLNADHSAMHEAMTAALLAAPGWEIASEVTFAIYGERGVVDILGFHLPTRRLLVVELKTVIVDVQAVLGTMDRYRRLAPRIARERGWEPVGVSTWLVVARSRTNERRAEAHRRLLRGTFPADGRRMRRWLGSPEGDIAAMSTVPVMAAGARRPMAGRLRVGRAPPDRRPTDLRVR